MRILLNRFGQSFCLDLPEDNATQHLELSCVSSSTLIANTYDEVLNDLQDLISEFSLLYSSL